MASAVSARRGGVVACVALAFACAERAPEMRRDAPPPVPSPARIPEPAKEARSVCREILRIEVSKSARTLRAYCNHGVRVDIPVALGPVTLGPKEVAGDLRTPEGRYHVVGAARPSRFHLFLPIDYPSVQDAERARAAGLITHEESERIRSAHARGNLPPQDTRLGGHLGLHGEGQDWRGASAERDWTLGCIAMSDEDIRFVAGRIVPNVVVEIRPD